MNESSTTPAHLAALEQRVTGLEKGVQDIANAVLSLTTKLDAKNTPNWQMLAVMLSFCTVVGGLAYWPVRETQSELKYSDKEIRSLMVPRSEHELFWKNYERTLDRIVKRLDRIEYGKRVAD